MLRRPLAYVPPAETVASPAPAPVQAAKPAPVAPAKIEAIDFEGFAVALVAALEAVPGALAQIDLNVGHGETYSLLKERLRTAAALAPAPEPKPVPAKTAEPAPDPEAPKPVPPIAVRRPGFVRPPARPLAVTTDAIVQAAAATAAPMRPRQSQDELEKLLAAVGSVEAESQNSEHKDVIPDAYVEPTISEEEALREPGEVALSDEPITDDPWVNPLRIGLPKPPRPLTQPTGVIVPLKSSAPAPTGGDDDLPDWVTSHGAPSPNDKSLIARLSAERSAKRRLTS